GEFEVQQKPDRSPVTQADLEVETAIREMIADRFPGDAVIGEEHGAGTGDRVWVVDPIDGTRNFADGVPIWATLLALQLDGRSELGLIEAPALGERYEAIRGRGARWNGHDLRVSERTLDDAFMVYSSVDDWVDRERHDAFMGLAREARRTRGFGDFWGHMLVARGAADFMVEPTLRIWDWAPITVIVEEAGGRVTTFDGDEPTDGSSILTSNAALHEDVVERLSGS
ncbi:MAG TPA: inositol monophosphatase family protein, partial [Actinomycetota bacterium]|nr:inositol monophosphatase family protein [Actinomycetota bacterium]